ncbi:MAG: hypothetical protein HY606_11690 [Planctomycetes bacterium]|nr:hypothetical protein [Planctomycetota bacterium]
MRKLIVSLFVLAIVSGCSQGMGNHSHDQIKNSGGYCKDCSVGYVDGKEVKCSSCYEMKKDKTGWCEGCKAGMVNGKKTSCKGCVDSAKSGEKCKSCKG